MVDTPHIWEMYTPVVFEKIERALGESLTPQRCGQIENAVQRFYGYWHLQKQLRSAKVRKDLTTLHKDAKTLSGQISDLWVALRALDEESRFESHTDNTAHSLPGSFSPRRSASCSSG